MVSLVAALLSVRCSECERYLERCISYSSTKDSNSCGYAPVVDNAVDTDRAALCAGSSEAKDTRSAHDAGRDE